MMENVLISIIVPVYNVEKYLGRCVESILCQSYQNLEIILVDDGSTDASGAICDGYSVREPRVRVIHQANGGLSVARNTGLQYAAGEYVFFTDSDDWLEPEAIGRMYQVAETKKADIVCCGIRKMYPEENNTGYREEAFTKYEQGAWDGAGAVKEMIVTNSICSITWNKLYRRMLWEGIEFPAGKIHEDEFTTYQVLYKAKKVVFIPDYFCNYFQRTDGIMALEGKSAESENTDRLEAYEKRKHFFEELAQRDEHGSVKQRPGQKEDHVCEQELADLSVVSYLNAIKYLYRKSGKGKREFRRMLFGKYRNSLVWIKGRKYISCRLKLSFIVWKYILMIGLVR